MASEVGLAGKVAFLEVHLAEAVFSQVVEVGVYCLLVLPEVWALMVAAGDTLVPEVEAV